MRKTVSIYTSLFLNLFTRKGTVNDRKQGTQYDQGRGDGVQQNSKPSQTWHTLLTGTE